MNAPRKDIIRVFSDMEKRTGIKLVRFFLHLPIALVVHLHIIGVGSREPKGEKIMTKQELTNTIKDNEFVLDFINEASEYAHKRCPYVPEGVEAYGDDKFWGEVTAYFVAVARKYGYMKR